MEYLVLLVLKGRLLLFYWKSRILLQRVNGELREDGDLRLAETMPSRCRKTRILGGTCPSYVCLPPQAVLVFIPGQWRKRKFVCTRQPFANYCFPVP